MILKKKHTLNLCYTPEKILLAKIHCLEASLTELSAAQLHFPGGFMLQLGDRKTAMFNNSALPLVWHIGDTAYGLT